VQVLREAHTRHMDLNVEGLRKGKIFVLSQRRKDAKFLKPKSHLAGKLTLNVVANFRFVNSLPRITICELFFAPWRLCERP
jgi:hypothetical protein